MITYRKVKALLGKDYVLQTSILPLERINFKRITLEIDGLLTIKLGYVWDFASGAIDSKAIREGSLAHDGLCELIHNHLLPDSEWGAAADTMFDVCRANGMSWIRAKWIVRAIKIAGPDVTVSRKWVTH